jgi:hypothetical protein
MASWLQERVPLFSLCCLAFFWADSRDHLDGSACFGGYSTLRICGIRSGGEEVSSWAQKMAVCSLFVTSISWGLMPLSLSRYFSARSFLLAGCSSLVLCSFSFTPQRRLDIERYLPDQRRLKQRGALFLPLLFSE